MLPSTFESWGLVMNEAMAAGTPVVVSTAVGAREDLVLEGATGMIFATGDVRALAACLRDLVEDPDRRIALGRAGREHIQGWSMDVYVSSVLRALDTTSGRRP